MQTLDYWQYLNDPLFLGAVASAFVVFGSFLFYRRRKEQDLLEKPSEKPALTPPTAETPAVAAPVEPVAAEKSVLADKLARTRGSLLGRLGNYLAGGRGRALVADEWDAIEEALLEGDVGVHTSTLLLSKIKARAKEVEERGVRALILEESEELLSGLQHGSVKLDALPKPYVISVVGVNGAGKTTTIGKLAQHFTKAGKVVLLGAGDTFRAAAISQLKVWADRAGAQFVTGREGADPGAVAFDSVAAGKARDVDVVLLDTAGRLHTKTNLMEELKKVHRVIKKVIPEAPHEVWLVLDGTTGQNALLQAREFQKTLDLTGVIITKLDGTAKGGAILAIAAELRLPIKYIGIGESAEDLISFEPRPFVQAILGES